MTGIIVTGCGFYATGVKSSIILTAGKQSNIAFVDFMESDDVNAFRKNLKRQAERMNDVENILFLTDVAGSVPFEACAQIVQEKIVTGGVVSGVNLPMVLEVLFARESATLTELKQIALESGLKGIKLLPKHEA